MSAEESPRRAEDLPLPGGDFRLFVQKLGYQALIGMGVVENPLTRETGLDLDRARTVIEDLAMLAEKTRGNLDEAEREHLEGVLSELREGFARLSGEARE